MVYKITIDGPSGAGKGCAAKGVSEKLGILNIDTGAIYRTVALYCKQNNVDTQDVNNLIDVINSVEVNLETINGTLNVYLNGENVSNAIRTEEVGMLAAKVSVVPQVREYVKEKQRSLAEKKSVVAEGRDIGSVVFPDAELKIYLTADIATRAYRRYKDLLLKDKTATYEKVLEQIQARDEADRTRKISPLMKTQDMIQIDNTNLTKEQVVDKILELAKSKGLI